MPGIFQRNAVNTAALSVPGTYILLSPPARLNLNGVPSDILGIVGIGSWGPVNAPVFFGADASSVFGNPKAQKYDLATGAYVAALQGANNMVGVRVTDGTDAKATALLEDTASATGATLTAIYTGTDGNGIKATVSAGSAASTSKLTVSMPGIIPEVFDNIASGAGFWDALVVAVNSGQSGIRGPSQIVTAAVGATTVAPALATVTASGGTDGNTTITASVLLGSNVAPRTGLYALTGTKCKTAFMADVDVTTTWAAELAWGLVNGCYMIFAGAAGQTIATGVTAKTGAALDSYGCKVILGDYCYINDPITGAARMVSPQGVAAGRRAALSPEQSCLNKPVNGVIGTQTSAANQLYADADIAQLVANGMDVIAAPSPGGNYFAMQTGQNASSRQDISDDSYTTMTNFIAATLLSGLGIYNGQVATQEERDDAYATLDSFFTNLQSQGMIEKDSDTEGPGFLIQLNLANNPQDRRALGYQQADVKVRYLGIVKKFIVNLQGGTSVVTTA